MSAPVPPYTVRRVTNPTDAEKDKIIRTIMLAFASDPFVSACTGGQLSDEKLFYAFTNCFVKGALVDGEIFVAEAPSSASAVTGGEGAGEESAEVLGASIWFPPGKDFMGTEEQREAVNLPEYLQLLKPGVSDWFMGTLLPAIGAICTSSLGSPTARLDAQHLQILGVHPEHQRRGIGRKLLEVAALPALEKGHRVVWETARAVNKRIYESWGAVERGHTEFESKFEGKNFPFWIMELPKRE